jgi:hypothetical protein
VASLGLALAALLVGLTLGGQPLTLVGRALVLTSFDRPCLVPVPLVLVGTLVSLVSLALLALLGALAPLALLGEHRVASSTLFPLLGLSTVVRALLGLPAVTRPFLGLPAVMRATPRFGRVVVVGAVCIAGRDGAPLALANHDALRHHARLDDDPGCIRSHAAVPMIVVDDPIVATAVVGFWCICVTDDPNIPLHGDQTWWWRSRRRVAARVATAARAGAG